MKVVALRSMTTRSGSKPIARSITALTAWATAMSTSPRTVTICVVPRTTRSTANDALG
jgi:hypothetical protein